MKSIFIFVAALFLASCGGAGTEDEGSSKSPSITMEKTVLYIQGTEGGSTTVYKEEMTFRIKNIGDGVYISAKNNSPKLIERVYLPIVSMSNESTLTIYAAQPYYTGLKKGTYQGTITLSLCEDNGCLKPIPNSEKIINIVYDVL